MSRRPDLLAALRSLTLFAHCTDAELAEIDSMTDEVAIAAGRAILRQGELGREFVVILEGQAEVTRDGVAVAVLGPGDHMGELALIVDHPRNATVTALTDVVAEVIDRRGFQTLIDDSPTLTRNLLRATATRLAELDDEVAELRARLAG